MSFMTFAYLAGEGLFGVIFLVFCRGRLPIPSCVLCRSWWICLGFPLQLFLRELCIQTAQIEVALQTPPWVSELTNAWLASIDKLHQRKDT